MRKAGAISLLSAVLVAPVAWWLWAGHGVEFGPGGLAKARAAFAGDMFLRGVLVANSFLYILAFVKIMFARAGALPQQQPQVQFQYAAPFAPAFIGMIDPDDPKWQALYSERGAAGFGTEAKARADAGGQAQAAQARADAGGQARAAQARADAGVPLASPAAAAGLEGAPTALVSAGLEASSAASALTGLAAKTDEAPTDEADANANANAARPYSPSAEDNIISIAEASVRKMYRSKLGAFFAERSYLDLGPASVDGVDLDFAAIASDDILAIGIIDSSFGSVVANDSSGISDSAQWYAPNKRYTSPVWRAAMALGSIKDMMAQALPPDNGVEIRAFVVATNASIENAEAARETWSSLGVDVVKLDSYQDNLDDMALVLPDRAGTEILDQYREFVETMLAFFNEKDAREGSRKAA
ncbi:MAG: hypothetical protein LBH41_01935 [Rickettsiales bacterium]|jgi:hypothetical protein|nr:hypothetical protein [Rickettsiales bacterium]